MNRTLRLTVFTLWSVLMTGLTYILGAPSLRVLRRRLGREKYWGLVLALSACFYFLRYGGMDLRALSFAFASLAILVGVFEEFEEMGFGFLVSTCFAVLINSMLAGGAFALWTYFAGPAWGQMLMSYVETTLKPLTDLNPKVQLNFLDLVLQLPSIAVILWVTSLYISVLIEDRLAVGDMAPLKRWPSLKPQLRELRLPDVFVWFFIASVLGALGDWPSRTLEAFSVNAMNVCILLFFFQGIAVFTQFLMRMKVRGFWYGLFVFIAVTQAFLVVSVIGLFDFWLDFRVRMRRKATAVRSSSDLD